MMKFYDPTAQITRSTPTSSLTTSLAAQQNQSILPFDVTCTVCKIFYYTDIQLKDTITISVFGSISNSKFESHFAQTFCLNYLGIVPKYFIIHDSFFHFDPITPLLYGAELLSVTPQVAPNPVVYQSQKTYQPPTPKPNIVPPTHRKLYKYSDFAPDRSLTISNLMNGYNGPHIVDSLSIYGKVENKYFTHNIVYIEFEKPVTVDIVLKANPDLQQGASVIISRGIRQNVKKPPTNYSRSKP